MANIERYVKSPEDLKELHELTKAIIGEPCWKIRLGYADELKLDIGGHIPYKNRLLAGKEHGTWRLGSRGTDWTLELPDKTVISSNAERDALQFPIQGVTNTNIVTFEAQFPGLGLVVGFSNGAILRIQPGPEDDEFDVAYWELFTPWETFVSVGPSSSWTYGSIHSPA